MLNASQREASVKYTMVIPKDCLDDLKELSEKKIIPSVSQGIRLAVEDFVAAQRRRQYEISMRDAATDLAFIKRTMDSQTDFSAVDAEGHDPW